MDEKWEQHQRLEINYSHFVPDTTLLGPYHRGVLWVQGCCFSCEGCVAQSMQGAGGSYAAPEQLAEYFLRQPGLEGLTISGGEPFLQAEALGGMMESIRSRKDMGLIVYSGLYLEELQALAEKKSAAERFLSQIDLLIDGRYEKKLDDGRMAVGSSNQTVHLLTDRYRNCADEYYQRNGRRTEITCVGNRLRLVGVPSAEAFTLWKNLTGASGSVG
ncbi:MAG: radical SAM protein [Lachnospiraceae bacterium]|nr:radical SAM protein [Lachnospiraceae bacterium]